jgi:transposase-like protein
VCVRWYVAYSLSLRNLEEMMAERGIGVDHSTVHRWVIRFVPLFEKVFRWQGVLLQRRPASSRHWHTEAPMMRFGPTRACSAARYVLKEVP